MYGDDDEDDTMTDAMCTGFGVVAIASSLRPPRGGLHSAERSLQSTLGALWVHQLMESHGRPIGFPPHLWSKQNAS